MVAVGKDYIKQAAEQLPYTYFFYTNVQACPKLVD